MVMRRAREWEWRVESGEWRVECVCVRGVRSGESGLGLMRRGEEKKS
jgi:hypothetical protein